MSEMDQFARYVASALRHLFDFAALARHPLAQALGFGEYTADARAQSLRRALLEAIDALRPGRDVPSDVPDWRLYRILRLRYIEGLSADGAMRRLALQKSQFYHDQRRALRTVADWLWQQRQTSGTAAEPTLDPEPPPQDDLVRLEAERLRGATSTDEIDLGELIAELPCILEPLARSRDVSLCVRRSKSPRIVDASRVPVRQAILHVASYGLHMFPGAAMEIALYGGADRVGVCVRVYGPECQIGAQEGPPQERMRLHVAEQLLSTIGGGLSVYQNGGAWEALLEWNALAPPVVLVVDDNQGFVDLFRRYLAGHDWQVVGASSETDLQTLIQETRPTVIIMDVLMPQHDGWEAMISLKSDERTCSIPIIVCSVLRESQIALSLGATAYLTKPVTEQSLLQALSPWTHSAPAGRQDAQAGL